MPDSQGRRYQVFVQEKRAAPHLDAGTVHAPDPELALFNARDVFVRRPSCISLWVVPVEQIVFLTAEQLAAGFESEYSVGEPQTYFVFAKERSAGTLTWVAAFESASAREALEKAREAYSERQPPFAWAVFPERAVVATRPEDIPSLFAPAAEKGFRMATDFHTHTVMRRLRTQPAHENEGTFQNE